MPSPPIRSEAEFALFAARAGFDLDAARAAELLAAFRHLERMAQAVRTARPLQTEPATTFAAIERGPRR